MTNALSPFARSQAVVIGVNEVVHVGRLTTAVADATCLATLLCEQQGYDDVISLTENVTARQLHSVMAEQLPAKVGEHDRLLFYFALGAATAPEQPAILATIGRWLAAHRTQTLLVKAKTGLLWNNNPRLPQLQQVILLQSAEESDTLNAVLDPGRYLWPSLVTTSKPTWLNRLEIEFVQKSIRRRASLLQRVIGITLAVVVILSGLTSFAFNQLYAAQHKLRASLSRELATQSLTGVPTIVSWRLPLSNTFCAAKSGLIHLTHALWRTTNQPLVTSRKAVRPRLLI